VHSFFGEEAGFTGEWADGRGEKPGRGRVQMGFRPLLQIQAIHHRVCARRVAFLKSSAEEILRWTEMDLLTENANARRGERWRWLLYVAVALAGGLLTFVGARAQQKATDDATFRRLIDAYCLAWSTGNADNPARFYAKEDGLVFYDVAPFSYHSWKEYHEGVKAALLDNMESGSLSAGKDLKVRRHGTVAWTTVSMQLSEKTKDGKNVETEIRYTGIWERRSSGWLLVHEHLSAPLGGS
jgi:ketosteroid isomerase-like protein